MEGFFEGGSSSLHLQTMSNSEPEFEDEGFWSPKDSSADFNSFFHDSLEQDETNCLLLMGHSALKSRSRKRQSPLRKAQSEPLFSGYGLQATGAHSYQAEVSQKHKSQNYHIDTEGFSERESLFMDIAPDIGISWKSLGCKLGIRRNVLDNIEDEIKKNEERVLEVLKTWSQREGNLADMRKLSTSLESIGRKDVADNIQRRTRFFQSCGSEEQLTLCLKKKAIVNKTEVMICQDKETGRLFQVKEVDPSVSLEDSQTIEEDLKDLHQRFNATKLEQNDCGCTSRANRHSNTSLLYPIQEVNEGSDIHTQLAVCEKLTDTLHSVFNSLVNLVGAIWDEVSPQVRKEVYDFAGELSSGHEELSQTLDEISKQRLSYEDEGRLVCVQEKFKICILKFDQLERFFPSVFFQRQRCYQVTPEDKTKRTRVIKRKRFENEVLEETKDDCDGEARGLFEISAPFMVRTTVPVPRKTTRSEKKM